jgi:urea transport system permease protein
MKNFMTLTLAAIFSLLAVMPATVMASDAQFSTLLDGLKQKSFSKKSAVIDQLEAVGDERALKIFQYMIEGKLYYGKSESARLLFAINHENGFSVVDVLNGESLGVVGKREIKKVKVNNKLRGQLRMAIAKLSLNNQDPNLRRDAVRSMFKNMDAAAVQLLTERLTLEGEAKVRDVIEVGIALFDLESADKQLRLTAVDILGDSLEPMARAALLPLVAKDEAGDYRLQDRDVLTAAIKALARIDAKLEYNNWAETIYFGLSLGSVLLLAAIGLAITFGVMGVINMAHGELIMIGAYTTYVVQLLMPNHIEYSLLVAIPSAFLMAGLIGIAIERGVIRFLYGRPLETLLATFGISLILQQLVRTVFSPLNRSVETPEWMSGAFEVNSALALTYSRFYIIIFSLLVFAALLLILKKTSLGLHVRAVSQNRTMARAMGIRSGWVDAMTFGLGSGIAGIAGVALSQLTNVGPNMGQAYIIDSFMVVVFGGVGNLWGTLVAAMSLGIINKVLEPWAGAVLAKIIVLIFIILFIQKKPRGLFPQRGRAAEH